MSDSTICDAMQKPNHYETHITVAPARDDVLERLSDWVTRNGLKWTHIVLDRGDSPSQPMVTFRGHGSIDTQRKRAAEIVRGLEQLGGRVVRIKTEGDVHNSEVPASNSDVLIDEKRYFEHHVKLRVDSSADLPALSDLVSAQGARLSRNARRTLCDGAQERFVTQRFNDRGRDDVLRELADLLQLLRDGGYDVIEVESEYVVYDSNLDLDAGWL